MVAFRSRLKPKTSMTKHLCFNQPLYTWTMWPRMPRGVPQFWQFWQLTRITTRWHIRFWTSWEIRWMKWNILKSIVTWVRISDFVIFPTLYCSFWCAGSIKLRKGILPEDLQREDSYELTVQASDEVSGSNNGKIHTSQAKVVIGT